MAGYTAPATAAEVRLTASEARNDVASLRQKLGAAVARISLELSKGTTPHDRTELLTTRTYLNSVLHDLEEAEDFLHSAEDHAREVA